MAATCANGTGAALSALASSSGRIAIAIAATASAAVTGIAPDRAPAVAEVEEQADPRADEHQRDEHEPAVVACEREREVRSEHREHDRQRQVVVVHRALLALDAVRGSGSRPACFARTSSQWPGMITKRTLATIIVPIIAPTWMAAPRALKSSLTT